MGAEKIALRFLLVARIASRRRHARRVRQLIRRRVAILAGQHRVCAARERLDIEEETVRIRPLPGYAVGHHGGALFGRQAGQVRLAVTRQAPAILGSARLGSVLFGREGGAA